MFYNESYFSLVIYILKKTTFVVNLKHKLQIYNKRFFWKHVSSLNMLLQHVDDLWTTVQWIYVVHSICKIIINIYFWSRLFHVNKKTFIKSKECIISQYYNDVTFIILLLWLSELQGWNGNPKGTIQDSIWSIKSC